MRIKEKISRDLVYIHTNQSHIDIHNDNTRGKR